MKRSFLSLALMLSLATVSHAMAQTPYVSIEERLTPEQLRSVGLTDEQLDTLNRMLREAHDGQGVAVVAPAATPVSNNAPAANRNERGRDEGSLIGFNDKPIQSRLKGPIRCGSTTNWPEFR